MNNKMYEWNQEFLQLEESVRKQPIKAGDVTEEVAEPDGFRPPKPGGISDELQGSVQR